MTPRRKAQIAQCCRGCPCKTVADCTGGAEPQKVVEYIKETAQCRSCGEHDGLILMVKVATGEERIFCDMCANYQIGKYQLA